MFHEIRFPTGISRNASGGPERRTDIVVLGSGHEQRNSRWTASRRTYNAGYGVRSLDELYEVISFFEERRGRLYGFRWRDHSDWKSCSPERMPSASDQELGIGDGMLAAFQLVKRYGQSFAPYDRRISKPVAASVLVAVDGAVQVPAEHYTIDATTGVISFFVTNRPPAGARVTAGYEFDVAARFDTDKLEINLHGFRHGAIPSIPIVEILT